MGLFDRRRLPADARVGLASALGVSGERLRVLAWAATPGGYAVALPGVLAVTRPDGAWESWPWQRLLSASWSDDGRAFTWRTVDRPHALHSREVTDPGRLPEVVRERVQQTIVAHQVVDLRDGIRATLTGRRPTEGDGPIEWTIVPPRGVDLRRPDLAEAASALLERVRRDWA